MRNRVLVKMQISRIVLKYGDGKNINKIADKSDKIGLQLDVGFCIMLKYDNSARWGKYNYE